MNVISIQSDVKNGELEPEKLAHLLRGAKAFEGKRVSIVLRLHEKLRSRNQENFLHGVFLMVLLTRLREAGIEMSFAQVKEYFKEKFGEKEVITDLNGEQCVILKSTARYTTSQYEESMERARAHYAKWFPLPFPNEGDL